MTSINNTEIYELMACISALRQHLAEAEVKADYARLVAASIVLSAMDNDRGSPTVSGIGNFRDIRVTELKNQLSYLQLEVEKINALLNYGYWKNVLQAEAFIAKIAPQQPDNYDSIPF